MKHPWTPILGAWLVLFASLPATPRQSEPPSDDAALGAVQDAPPEQPPQPADQPATEAPRITTEQVQDAMNRLDEARDLDEASRAAARDLLTQALRHLERAAETTIRRAEFENQTSGAARRLEDLRTELAQPPATPRPDPPPDATITQLEQSLSQAKADLEAARRKVAEIESEQATRSARRSAIPGEVATLRQELEEVTSRLQGAAAAETPLDQARLMHDRALQQSLRREIDALEAELRSYDARRELLPLRLDRAKRQVRSAEAAVAAWQALVDAARKEEARRAEQEARRLLESAREHPALERFADQNALLAERGAAIAAALAQTAEQRTRVREQIDRVTRSFAETRRDVARLGLKQSIGERMRDEIQSLDLVSFRDALKRTEEAWDRAYDEIRTFEEDRENFQDVDTAVDELLEKARRSNGRIDSEALGAVARELVTARRQLLDRLLLDAQKHIEALEELQEERALLLARASAYRSFIEERILWVRTFDLRTAISPDTYIASLRWLLNAERLARVPRGIIDHPALSLTILLALAAWSLITLRLRRVNRSISTHTSSYRTDSFRHTWASLALTLLTATPVPLLLYWTGWLLTNPIGRDTELGHDLGAGLQAAAISLYPYFLIDRALAPDGLADAHFKWPPHALRRARRELRWYIPSITPLLAIMGAAMRSADEDVTASFGRIALLLAMSATSVFLFRLLRAAGPFKQYYERNPASLVIRLRPLWFPLAVALPVALAVLSWSGFHYTATRLHDRFVWTIALVAALILLNALLGRWLFLARRRIAVEDARRRREQALADADAAATSDQPHPDVPPLDEQKINLPAMSAQTRQLFRSAILLTALAGAWLTWIDVVPALRVLDRLQLWPRVGYVEPAPDPALSVFPDDPADAPTPAANATPAPGAPTPFPAMIPQATPAADSDSPPPAGDAQAAPFSLTAGDLLFAIIALLVTWIAFRNLPGLVELLILQRLPLDAGARYALSTVLRYIIAIIGVSVAAGAIGLSWTKIQWLAAALTFGLAFGLQEIFANFVSGLIILAERPVRVGDTVTIGGINGTVSRIRMRATTITDWDRKELIIPNKTFITGDVINWTLSDSVLRIVIPVGVSYGADVEKAERVLTRIARENKTVLEDPPPQVWFMGFGDSTLNFELRVYIPTIERLLQTRHELHNAILREFRKAGIEIAFPQRDLHIRSSEGLARLLPTRETPHVAQTGDPL